MKQYIVESLLKQDTDEYTLRSYDIITLNGEENLDNALKRLENKYKDGRILGCPVTEILYKRVEIISRVVGGEIHHITDYLD